MLTLDKSLSRGLLQKGSFWRLDCAVNGYANSKGIELATQAGAGRSFELLELPSQGLKSQENSRLWVRFLEDGYRCWLDLRCVYKAIQRGPWSPLFLTPDEIQNKIPEVLKWIREAATEPNEYLWGGTLGPDFDCSGLIQTAFLSAKIWLPRDAYQQESFCKPLQIDVDHFNCLIPGDLLFFGTPDRCTHVAIHQKAGIYWHSSGFENGRNGIGFDSLSEIDQNPVASFYRSHFRGAGRVQCCCDGSARY